MIYAHMLQLWLGYNPYSAVWKLTVIALRRPRKA